MPERKIKIGELLIEEFIWNGKYIVYANNKLCKDCSYEQVVEMQSNAMAKGLE